MKRRINKDIQRVEQKGGIMNFFKYPPMDHMKSWDITNK